MIKIANTDVWGFRGAIRGMRHPYKSTNKCDSGMCYHGDTAYDNYRLPDSPIDCEDCPYYVQDPDDECEWFCEAGNDYNKDFYVIGSNDLKLAQSLANAGDDHGKFLRMIHVQADVTAPLYWWKEYDTYKVGTVANSESTMHTIMQREFTLNDFSLNDLAMDGFEELDLLDAFNDLRFAYLNESDSKKKKRYWTALIQLLPESYNQTRTIDLNYQVLKHIYHARKNHKLSEWHEFCAWIELLPYSELIIGERDG